MLVRHEKPHKFESKWLGPLSDCSKKMLLANIRTADKLRDIWASPEAKDKLRRRNRDVELIPSYAENTDILNQHLHVDDEDEDFDEVSELEIDAPMGEKNSKRTSEVFQEITVRTDPPPWEKKKVRRSVEPNGNTLRHHQNKVLRFRGRKPLDEEDCRIIRRNRDKSRAIIN